MTKVINDPDLDALFRDGATWAEARQLSDARTVHRTSWIAGIAAAVAILEAIALAFLVPLKTVVPLTVLVDRQTGYVTTLDPTRPMTLAPDEALTKSMLAQYVVARETVDRATVPNDYRKTMLWSGDQARNAYLATMKPGSLQNPFAGLPANMAQQVAVKSVSLLASGQAMVRFDLTPTGASGATTQSAYVTIIAYRYRDRSLSEGDRFVNPLGFEVDSYRRDPEVAPTALPVTTMAPATSVIVQTPATVVVPAR